MSQTAYTQDPAFGTPGLLFDVSRVQDIVTGIAQEVLPFGRAVARIAIAGTDDAPPGFDFVDAAGDIDWNLLVGFALSDVTLEKPQGALVTLGWAIDEAVRVLRQGRMWVDVEDAVTAGADVFVRHTAEAPPLDQLGVCRSDVSGGNAAALPGATFHTSTTGVGIAVIDFRPQT